MYITLHFKKYLVSIYLSYLTNHVIKTNYSLQKSADDEMSHLLRENRCYRLANACYHNNFL